MVETRAPARRQWGVDTHAEVHVAAALDPAGGLARRIAAAGVRVVEAGRADRQDPTGHRERAVAWRGNPQAADRAGTGGAGHGVVARRGARAEVRPSAVSNRICWSGRGRSPFQIRAAVAVSGWPAMLTRVMSPVPAGRGNWITPGGGPAMTAGPVSTAVGRLAVAAKVSATGRECRTGGSVNSNRGWAALRIFSQQS